MTNEELDKARAEEAVRLADENNRMTCGAWIDAGKPERDPVLIAARLAREGWVPVDPDLVEARVIGANWGIYRQHGPLLAALKRGRELERGGK